MSLRTFASFACLGFSAFVALPGCGAGTSADASTTSADLTRVSIVPAHFHCSAPKAVDLDVVTTRTEVKVTDLPGDTKATGRLHANGSADLGEFISEDHETYSIKLDAKMLRGEPGHAVLTTNEPDGPAGTDTYTCVLASVESTPKTCPDSALADGHLQPGTKGGPDSKGVVTCEQGYTMCRIDPNGPDNDVCGDPDDCFACSR
jgi:hypothetical protein